jgi:hypothetical protein
MRRRLVIREREGALVAVYDALLFLMVVVLISVGMFLYTARNVDEGGGFSDSMYQRLTDDQLHMVEALTDNTLNTSIPVIHIPGSNASVNLADLTNLTGVPEAYSVKWMLTGLCELRMRAPGNVDTPDQEAIGAEVRTLVEGNYLPNAYQAWAFTYNGTVILFGSNANVTNIGGLPMDRWATASEYMSTVSIGEVETTRYRAELLYFLWLP